MQQLDKTLQSEFNELQECAIGVALKFTLVLWFILAIIIINNI
jgi:hypothetical protein